MGNIIFFAMTQLTSHWPLTTETHLPTQGQSMQDLWWTKWCWDIFATSTSAFPCQYLSTIAPLSFIHLPPTLYNVFLPVFQFPPVSIIPPLPHTHSFIYHPCCIMFFSQDFRFPLSVSFHHCSILIHSSTTHTV